MNKMPLCKYHNECVFRDKYSKCHILNDTLFIGKACPFRKTKEQEIKELKFCCHKIGYNWKDYKTILKQEVFDIFVYKNLFGGDSE